MNVVIFSYLFPPSNEAEAFCCARFASALASNGHNVHVVTMEHNWEIDREVYDFLVNQRIKITKVSLKDKSGIMVWPRLWHRMFGREACEIKDCVSALKKVLNQYEHPVLISRSMPEVSNVIAWYCRRHALKWIAHFSDPYPWSFGSRGPWKQKIIRAWGRSWGKRIIQDANLISLTCNAARRFFCEQYGALFDVKNVVISTHIGEPILTTNKTYERASDCVMIAHAGSINLARGAKQVFNAIKQLNKKGVGLPFCFCQSGNVDFATRELFEREEMIKIVGDGSPETAMAVIKASDISYIPDLITPLGYSPFLPSKFVYQVFFDMPIVVYTYKDAEMAKLAKQFPEAGIVFADVEKENSLVDAFLLASKIKHEDINRDAIRKLFTRKAISRVYDAL